MALLMACLQHKLGIPITAEALCEAAIIEVIERIGIENVKKTIIQNIPELAPYLGDTSGYLGDEVTGIIENLEKNHDKHIALYGAGLGDRLTGDHETCSINEFRSGNSDRGASIRVPIATALKGYGYLEDRRPGANSDPYLVAARILVSICELAENLMTTKAILKAEAIA